MSRVYDWSVSRRQPVEAILVVLQKVIITLIKLLWPLLLVWIFNAKKNESGNREIFIIIISALTLILSLLEYWFFRFSIRANELLVRKGFFTRRNLALPLEKIQAVHIDQDWLHRLLRLSQVSFDSPGSKNAEVKITMHMHSAEALRNHILETGSSLGSEPALAPLTARSQPPFFRIESYDLFRLGLSANHLEAFFILLAFGLSVMDDLETIIGKQLEGPVEWISELASSDSGAAVLLLIVTGLVVSIIVSFARIILRYGNFRISKTSKAFRIQSGLVNIREKLVPFNKVQYISWKANWIRQHIPYYLLQFHSIGTTETKRKWEIKIPVTRKELLPELLTDYHPELSTDSPAIRVQPGYIYRRVIMAGLLPALIIAGFGYFIIGLQAAWIFLLIPYRALASWLYKKNFRLFIHKEVLQVHEAIFGREESLLRWQKIQSVKIRQSIYQRKRSLASVLLYTAGGVIHIPFIRLEQARQLLDYSMYKVESTVNLRESVSSE